MTTTTERLSRATYTYVDAANIEGFFILAKGPKFLKDLITKAVVTTYFIESDVERTYEFFDADGRCLWRKEVPK